MIKSDPLSSKGFDRPKLLLFKFLAHQIHPFAYAVNTFLRPALDDCLELMVKNPQDTFHVLLSLSQTFTRFAPESELIYDDIQQFAIKLKDVIDQCYTYLDSETIRQTSQVLQSAHRSLLAIIQQENEVNTTYTDMYKNMSAVLANLEKINSLPTEMQLMSLDKIMSNSQSIKQEPIIQNGYSDRTTTIAPPPGILSKPTDRSTTLQPPLVSVKSEPHGLSPKSIQDQMMDLSIGSTPVPTIPLSRATSNASYQSEYDIIDTSIQPVKKPTANIACFPPRQSSSLFNSINSTNDKLLRSSTNTTKIDTLKGHGSSSLLNKVIKNDIVNNENERDDSVPIGFKERAIPTTTALHSLNDYLDNENNEEFFSDSCLTSSVTLNTESVYQQSSYMAQSKTLIPPHVTDEYIQEFGNKQSRPILRGELFMTYGTPQNSVQTTCLPIGVGLSYDELTLLSCDVHRNAQTVRLFDIQTGKLKHTIASNQAMKLHRPGAVMSNARNNILIVERDSIYITESDGRLIKTLTHRSIKQLYGIASFRDRYVLTIDSKAIDNQSSEHCRLLLFDPNSGQLVFEQNISINRESETILRRNYINNIHGRVLPETTSKPRFIAVHNDDIYIADLGRSLIYGTKIRNQFEFACTTVFGGHGRGNGEMFDPSGLFIDSGGNIISADSKNDRIQLFSSDGKYKTTFKLNERLKRPSGICVNRSGTQFFVSCYLAGCVRAFNIAY